MTTAIYGNSIYSLLNDAPSWTIANDTAKESGGEMMIVNTLNE